jgi:hypothetical protein
VAVRRIERSVPVGPEARSDSQARRRSGGPEQVRPFAFCRDLGIVPSHPLWSKVMMAVTEFGGNYARLFSDVVKRACTWLDDPGAPSEDARPTSGPQAAAVCATGPP